MMRHRSAMTLIDTLFMLLTFIAVAGTVLPIISRSSMNTRQRQNSTQIRGIHSGRVLYAQGNNSHYVGIKSDGLNIDPTVGLTTQGRVQKLIEDNYFTVEYARSPSENQTGTTSYAMLQVNRSDDETTVLKGGRNKERKDTTNPKSIVISDRAVDHGSHYSYIKSIRTNPKPQVSEWHGEVGWNDNHVTLEKTFTLQTQYGPSRHTADNLFGRSSNAKTGDDAFMVWHGTDKL